jgi:hypothetical protein
MTYNSYYFNEAVNIQKVIFSAGIAIGNVATSNSTADAYGYDSLTQTFTNTVTTPYSSSSSGTSISVSN